MLDYKKRRQVCAQCVTSKSITGLNSSDIFVLQKSMKSLNCANYEENICTKNNCTIFKKT